MADRDGRDGVSSGEAMTDKVKPETCPRCVSDDPSVRYCSGKDTGKMHTPEDCCTDPWHSTPEAAGEPAATVDELTSELIEAARTLANQTDNLLGAFVASDITPSNVKSQRVRELCSKIERLRGWRDVKPPRN